VTQGEIGPQPPRRGGSEGRSVAFLMASTFAAAVAFVAVVAVLGGVIGPSPARTISVVSGPLVTRVDAQLVDIYTDLYDGRGRAAGTGMVLTPGGDVLTNNHVIEGASTIRATDIGNGQTYVARVIGYDERRDIAVLALENARGLATVRFGDSARVGLGEGIVTIGNAGGIGGAPAARSGTVIGLSEAITIEDDVSASTEHLDRLIQIDGDLEPGDSGGPMVDGTGAVIGMDTAASTSFEFSRHTAGQGFAIAIDAVKPVAAQIRARHGSDAIHIGPTAFIGVDIGSGAAQPAGVIVANAVPGTPAARAGLGYGDVITAIGGTAVSSPADLTNALVRYSPGATVALDWVDRASVEHTAVITLAAGPAA
jgi:S1-C subfamily serine protease